MVLLVLFALAAQAPPGRLVDIGGYKLHLHCTGKGLPTVILDAGLGDSSNVWALVQPELSRTTRVCSYDRAGAGWSDLGPMPRTMKQQVWELHELLQRANERQPLVLVGHSYAGLLARLYAAAYPEQVKGMVLVDSTHESVTLGMRGRLVRVREESKGRQVPAVQTMATSPPKPAPAEDLAQAESFLADLKAAGKLGPPYDRLPAAARQAEFHVQTHPKLAAQAEDYWAEELQAMYEHRQSLGALPLVVLAAGKAEGPPELQQEKAGQKRDLATLSSNSRFVRDPASGHHLHLEHPALVIDEIRLVIAAARRGHPLPR